MTKLKTPTHIKELIADPENRRKHTPRNVGLIVEALHKVGAARSVVIDEEGVVLAGNATIEAAAEAGITDLKVVEASGNEVVAVRRTGLSDDQKRSLALYDNRAAELAEWDVDQLVKAAKDGVDLALFFSEDELTKIVGKVLGEDEPKPEIDFSPEIDFHSDYVVLKFNTDIDALYMQEIFGLKPVKASIRKDYPEGKPYRAGVGRIVDGMEGIKRIREHFRGQDD